MRANWARRSAIFFATCCAALELAIDATCATLVRARTAFGNEMAMVACSIATLVGILGMFSWALVVVRSIRVRPRQPRVAIAAVAAIAATGLAAFVTFFIACSIAAHSAPSTARSSTDIGSGGRRRGNGSRSCWAGGCVHERARVVLVRDTFARARARER